MPFFQLNGINMMITNQTQNDIKRQLILDAGYTICSHNVGTVSEGWHALLPGETQFFDNSDQVDDNPDLVHNQNYVGFFSCEQDLLDEVADLVQEEKSSPSI